MKEVFAFLSDPASDPTWRPHGNSIAAEGPMGAAAIVRPGWPGHLRGLPGDDA